MPIVSSTQCLFFLVGFVTDLTSLSEFYLLRELDLDVANCYAAATLVNAVWGLRPVFGYVSDWAGHRHMQLAGLFITAFFSWMIVRGMHQVSMVIGMLVMCEITAAAGLTIADAYVVRMTKDDDGAMPKHHRFRIVGRIAASFLSGHMLTKWGTTHQTIVFVFLMQALVYLVAAPWAVLFLEEEEEEPEKAKDAEQPQQEEGVKSVWYVRQVMDVVWAHPKIRFVLVCFTLYAALPDSGTSVSYFLVGPLRISPLTLATIDAVRGVFDFLGTFTDPNVPVDDALTTLFSVGNVLGIAVGAVVCRSCVWIDDAVVLVITSAISAWISSAFSTVFSVQIAKISPKGKEGGFYNSVVSIPNVGQLVGVCITYLMTRGYAIDHDDFSRLPEFTVVTSILGCVASVCFALFK